MAAKPQMPAILARLQPSIKAALQAEADAQMRSLSNLAALILTEYAETRAKPKANGAHRATHKSQAAA